MKTNSSLALAIMMATALSLSSKQLSPQAALSRANQEGSRAASAMQLKRTITDHGMNTIYIFAGENGKGQILLSADDVAVPVLGYCEDVSVASDSIAPEMAWWLQTLSSEISQAASAPIKIAAAKNPASVDNSPSIKPLLKTKWGQGAPFNDLMPTIGGYKTPTGCVATALAQVMNYEKWPEQPTGKCNYNYNWGGTKYTYTMNLDTVQFNWSNTHPDYFSTPSTESQRKEIAKIMQAVGYAVKMNYAPGASSATAMDAASALVNKMKYAPSVVQYDREYFTYENWKCIIYKELAVGHPVIYTGVDDNGGHCFICDGFDTGGYFHIDWGWNGTSNGYYVLSALTPAGRTTISSANGYNTSQSIVCGLRRNDSGATVTPVVRTASLSVEREHYTRGIGDNVVVIGENGIFYMGVSSSRVNLGLKLVGEDGATYYIPSTTDKTMIKYSAVPKYEIPTTSFPADGTYEATAVYQDSKNEWHNVLVPLTANRNFTVRITDSNIDIYNLEAREIEVSEPEILSPLFIGEIFGMKVTFTNPGIEYYDALYPVLIKNGTIVARGPRTMVDVDKNGESTVEFVGSFSNLAGQTLTAGKYDLAVACVRNGSYVVMGETTEIAVRNAVKSAPQVYTSVAQIGEFFGEETSIDYPAYIEDQYVSSMVFSFELSCTSGYFGEYLGVTIYPLDDPEPKAEYGPTFVGLEAGATKKVDIEADLTHLDRGVIYMVIPNSSSSGQFDGSESYFVLGDQVNAINDGGGFYTGISNVAADESQLTIISTASGFEVQSSQDIKGVQIYTIDGRQAMATTAITGQGRASVNTYNQKGIFIIRVALGDGSVKSKRIVK